GGGDWHRPHRDRGPSVGRVSHDGAQPEAAGGHPAHRRRACRTYRAARAGAARVEGSEPHAQQQPRQAPPATRPSVEQAATAAVAAALATPDDVTIRPITPKTSLFVAPGMRDPA